MKTIERSSDNSLRLQIDELKDKLEIKERKRKEIFSRIAGISTNNILIVDHSTPKSFEECIYFKVNSLQDAKGAIESLKPYNNDWDIKHTICDKLISRYKVTINNGFHEANLRIKWGGFNGIFYQLNIELNSDTAEALKDVICRSTRGLYDCETHYVNMPSHYKRFKDIRVPAFDFYGRSASWYGGDKTSVELETNDAIVGIIKAP